MSVAKFAYEFEVEVWALSQGDIPANEAQVQSKMMSILWVELEAPKFSLNIPTIDYGKQMFYYISSTSKIEF